jgi:hypothetical protein
MKKIIAFAAFATIPFSSISPAMAADKPSVVIIDSGFDSNIIKPIKEVCILTVNYCNNGTSLDESTGASNTTLSILPSWKSEWNHGLIMADIVRQVSPDANLIFIRNAFVTSRGAINIGGIDEFKRSLQWVIANKAKYNIASVSFSRGQQSYLNTSTACPVDKTIQSQIVTLQTMGTATIIAAGNNGNKKYVDYPACIPEAIAISGIFSQNYTPNVWSSYRQTLGTNSGDLTDFFAYGNFNTVAGRVAESTSSSTAAFAGYWSKVSNGNYFETYEKLSKSTSNKFINVLN